MRISLHEQFGLGQDIPGEGIIASHALGKLRLGVEHRIDLAAQ